MKRRTKHISPAPAARQPSQAIPQPAAVPPSPSPESLRPLPEDKRGLVATEMLFPEMSASLSMDRMMDKSLVEAGIGPETVVEMLKEQGKVMVEGDLAQVRRTLAAQVITLDRMFHYLFKVATEAHEKGSQDISERYLRLALRAQAQSTRTAHAVRVLGGESSKPAAVKPKVAPVPRKNYEPAPVSKTPLPGSPHRPCSPPWASRRHNKQAPLNGALAGAAGGRR